MTALPRLPFAQPHPLQTAPGLRELQKQGPIHRVRTSVNDEAWLVTGYAETRRLLEDKRLGWSHPNPKEAARAGLSLVFGGPVGDFEYEWEYNARMRSLLQPLLSPREIRKLAPRVAALTSELLDGLAGDDPPSDLHAKVIAPLPVLVLCELLGVPADDRDQYRSWIDDAANFRDREISKQGVAELFRYGVALVREKRRRPADDLVSKLCMIDGVEDQEAATLSMGLLFAGQETTISQLGLGVLCLLTDPGLRQSIIDEPTLIARAAEELLRAPGGGGGGLTRYAREDFEIHGFAIRKGDLVLLDMNSANHDVAVFAEPDHCDFARQGAAHLSFGHGPRYCLGAPLARLELHTVFSQLISRFPDMEVAVDPSTLPLRTDMLAGGVVELPVTW